MANLLDLLEREKELNEKIACAKQDLEAKNYQIHRLVEDLASYECKLEQIRGFIKKYFEEL